MNQPKLDDINEKADALLKDPEGKSAGLDALNDKKFLDVLAKYSVETGTSEDELVPGKEKFDELFEAYSVQGDVTKNLVGIYNENLVKNSGIKFEKGELNEIGKSLEKALISNPNRITEINKSIQQFQNFPKEIENLESEIIKRSGLPEGVTFEDALKKMQREVGTKTEAVNKLKYSNFLQRSVTVNGQKIKKGWFNIEEIDKVLEETKTNRELIGKINQKHGEIGERVKKAEEELLDNLPFASEVNKMVQQKLTKKFNVLFDPKKKVTVEEAGKLTKEYDRLHDLEEKGELYMSDEMADDEFKEKLDNRVKEIVKDGMIVALEKAYEREKDPLKNLQKYFFEVLQKVDNKDLTNEWFRTTLETFLDEMQKQFDNPGTMSPEELEKEKVRLKAKRILIKSYLQQLPELPA